MLNVLLITLGLAALTELAGPVARAGRVPRRHADRRDRVPLPGRGGHQAVPRRAARAVLRHRRHGARPRASSRANCGWVLLLLVVPVAGEARADRGAVARCSARRSARRCASASTSRRRASSRSCCWRSRADTTLIGRAARAARAGGDGAVDAVGAAVIQFAEPIVRRLTANDWLARAAQVTQIAATTMARQDHVIICGYGRSGQNLARLLEAEDIPFIALDADPERVREAAGDGSSVVYGDAGRARGAGRAPGSQGARRGRSRSPTRRSRSRSCTTCSRRGPELPVIVRTRRRQRARPAARRPAPPRSCPRCSRAA